MLKANVDYQSWQSVDYQCWLPCWVIQVDFQFWLPILTTNVDYQCWLPMLTNNVDYRYWLPQENTNVDYLWHCWGNLKQYHAMVDQNIENMNYWLREGETAFESRLFFGENSLFVEGGGGEGGFLKTFFSLLPSLSNIDQRDASASKNTFSNAYSKSFYRGRIQLKINCANNKLTCEGGKTAFIFKLYVFLLLFVKTLLGFPKSVVSWFYQSRYSDICFAALIRLVHFVIMSPILIMSMCRTEMFFSLIFYAIHRNHLQMIMYEQSLDFCILFTFWHILQWFNHFWFI